MEIGTFADADTTTTVTIWFADESGINPHDYVRVTDPSTALDAIARKCAGRSDVRALHHRDITYSVYDGESIVRHGGVGRPMRFRLFGESAAIIRNHEDRARVSRALDAATGRGAR